MYKIYIVSFISFQNSLRYYKIYEFVLSSNFLVTYLNIMIYTSIYKEHIYRYRYAKAFDKLFYKRKT